MLLDIFPMQENLRNHKFIFIVDFRFYGDKQSVT